MNKICPRCNESKDILSFRPNKHRKDGYQSYCIPCDKEFQKEWYKENKVKCITKAIERNKKSDKEKKEFILDYLSKNPCAVCGEPDIVVLEFDHIRDKSKNISNMIQDGSTLNQLKKELVKCQVLCANCHKRKTAKDFKWYKYDHLPNIGLGISLQN